MKQFLAMYYYSLIHAINISLSPPVDKAVDYRYQKDSSCSSFDRTIVTLDTEDQYQTFSLLEPLLRKPPALASSPVVNMPFITDTLLQQ